MTKLVGDHIDLEIYGEANNCQRGNDFSIPIFAHCSRIWFLHWNENSCRFWFENGIGSFFHFKCFHKQRLVQLLDETVSMIPDRRHRTKRWICSYYHIAAVVAIVASIIHLTCRMVDCESLRISLNYTANCTLFTAIWFRSCVLPVFELHCPRHTSGSLFVSFGFK